MTTSLLTSTERPTEGQKKDCVRVITDATEKAVRKALNELEEAGTLNRVTMQQIHASGDSIGEAAAHGARTRILEVSVGRVGVLKLISGGQKVVIKAITNGTETLASATDIFGTNIDLDYRNWGCDKKEAATAETGVQVYEQVENANYRRMFGGFGQNLDQLCVTTCQAKRFVADEAVNYLREDGWAVFLFLFKVKAEKKGEKDEFFVAYVYVRADGYRHADVYRFSCGNVWGVGSRFRVVVPQLALGK